MRESKVKLHCIYRYYMLSGYKLSIMSLKIPIDIWIDFLKLFFNWRSIVLQNFVVFCQISAWISHNAPSLLNLTPISFTILPPSVVTESLFEFSETYGKFPLAVYFTYGNVSFHVTLSIHLTLSLPSSL